MNSPTDLRHLVRRLRFRHLELLQIMETAATVRAAADRMQLTQPAITRMLKEIESIFDSQLFERSARGITALPIGARLIAHAIVLVNQLDGARHEIEISRERMLEQIRVGAFSGARIVAVAVGMLTRQHPNLRVEIREMPIPDLLDALLRGELDCVLGSLPPDELRHARIDELRMSEVADESASVVAARDSPWARKRRVSWEELQGERWILPPRASLLRRAFIAAHLERGLTPPTPAVEVMSPLTLRTLIVSGAGSLGIARRQHAKEDERLKVLSPVRVAPQLHLPPMMLFTRRQANARFSLIEGFRNALLQASQEN